MYYLSPAYSEFHDPLLKSQSDYRSYVKDVDNFIANNLSFADLWVTTPVLLDENGIRLFKIRIADSANKRGQSAGYRMYVLCVAMKYQNGNIITPVSGNAYLIGIHPKHGKMGIPKFGDETIKRLIKETIGGITSSTCKAYDKTIKNYKSRG